MDELNCSPTPLEFEEAVNMKRCRPEARFVLSKVDKDVNLSRSFVRDRLSEYDLRFRKRRLQPVLK
jgi:hypothetical protein